MMTNTFIQGNSFELLCRLPDNHFDMVHTDPPYGLNGIYGRREHGRSIANDENLDWMPDVAHQLYRVLKNNTFCVVWSKWVNEPLVRKIFESQGFSINTVGIWNKEVQGLSGGGGFAETYEQWIVFEKGLPKEYYSKAIRWT
jgi:adenine-specific DNA-methyltransferase